jgi:transposase-like protein
MIGIVDLQRAETDLAAGELACPGCGGTLRRWGHARPRLVRDHASTTLPLRLRRARCTACGATHVLLLGAVLPRRADTTAVIGTALLASVSGVGYRRIAADLGRPPSTVRRWVRSVRCEYTEWLRAQGVGWIDAIDRDVFATLARAPEIRRHLADHGCGPRSARRQRADHGATMLINATRNARFSSARSMAPTSAPSAAGNTLPAEPGSPGQAQQRSTAGGHAMPFMPGTAGARGQGTEHRRPPWLLEDGPEAVWLPGLPPHGPAVIGAEPSEESAPPGSVASGPSGR